MGKNLVNAPPSWIPRASNPGSQCSLLKHVCRAIERVSRDSISLLPRAFTASVLSAAAAAMLNPASPDGGNDRLAATSLLLPAVRRRNASSIRAFKYPNACSDLCMTTISPITLRASDSSAQINGLWTEENSISNVCTFPSQLSTRGHIGPSNRPLANS